MKKNILMRIGSTALVLTMMTSYIISGTYAKYATQNSSSDTARVAKFGVDITATGSLFGKQYVNLGQGNGSTGTITVSSSENVVAPGTQNTDGITFKVTGTPEVDVSVSIAASSISKVVLKSNTSNFYPNTVTENLTNDTFNVTADYYPVLYTLKKNGAAVAGATNVTFDVLATKLQATTTYDAGTTLNATYNITWKWDFNDATLDNEITKKDTLLGDIAAAEGATTSPVTIDGVSLAKSTHYNLSEAVSFTLTAVQID